MTHLPPREPGAAFRVVEGKAPPTAGMTLFGVPSGEALASDPRRLATPWEGQARVRGPESAA
ncbi:hypothetical protein ACH47Z_29070 [Streptomyces sp. NPDC020192]|uniref:hypothetical protein n=1 Tax=Streptomyces sp. NPDC020192 TaxID=3365066 RepID=UPI0037B06C81